jgi:rubrerythrin
MPNAFRSIISRRDALTRAALLTSAAFSSYTAGGVARVFASAKDRDLTILNAALYLEHEAIAAYEAGAASGLLSPDVLKIAAAFMDDHKYHRDGIAGVVRALGETPAASPTAFHFGRLRDATDILNLALRLEQGAATAYRTLASSVQDKAVLGFAAHVMVDEVRHSTVLRGALGMRNH